MRTMIKPHILIAYLLALAFSAQASGAGLSARLERTRIAEGETVLLRLIAPGDSTGSPDLSPLGEDFDILNQGQSTRMSYVNGRSTSSREWQLVLAPKHTGTLRLPAIHLGGAVSEPLSLEVLPAAQAGKLGVARPVLLEVEAQPKRAYVQQKVIYTLRLLFREPLREASLSEPQTKDAIVERLGADKQYTVERDGQQYRVIERRYALFPQHSGPLEIGAPLLSAQIPQHVQRASRPRRRSFGSDPFADFDRLFGGDQFLVGVGNPQLGVPVQVVQGALG